MAGRPSLGANVYRCLGLCSEGRPSSWDSLAIPEPEPLGVEGCEVCHTHVHRKAVLAIRVSTAEGHATTSEIEDRALEIMRQQDDEAIAESVRRLPNLGRVTAA